MIDRLNFFDLYGYLIPGLVLGLVLSLPYALSNPGLLSIDLGSGVVAIVVAYVLGHQLYGLAELTLLSKVRIGDSWQHYSQFILYKHDPTNAFRTNESRRALRNAIDEHFKASQPLESRAGDPGAPASGAETQHLHFFDCRAALLQKKLASYAEQFQGMYVLARGVCLATALGSFHVLGWLAYALFAGWLDPTAKGVLVAAIGLSALTALWGALVLALAKRWPGVDLTRPFNLFSPASDRERFERRWAWCVVGSLAVLLFCTAFLGAARQPTRAPALGVAIGFFACWLISFRSYAGDVP